MRTACRGLNILILMSLGLWSLACGGEGASQSGEKSSSEQSPRAASQGVSLTIVSGSENKSLESLVVQYGRRVGADIKVRYQGSVDISLALENGREADFDAVWPANSLWLVLGDRHKVVKHEKSIMRSPVVFGVKKSVAESLGWVDKPDLRVGDILAAAEAGKLRFAMTSATQSNSGASAYFGFLSAMAGSPDVLSIEHLENKEVRDQVRRLLKTVDRSSGSSGWLRDLVVQSYDRFDAMVNYEALVIEANQDLESRGLEPFYAIYPIDGMTIADSPLAYVDKGDKRKEELFLGLQEHLLSPSVQANLGAVGRRTGLLGLDAGSMDRSVFRDEWGISPERVISPIPVPEESVVRAALELYQTALRKPSLTAYVLDYSGSMRGDGIANLKTAMSTLLDKEVAKRYWLQPSQDDVHIVIPFDGAPRAVWRAQGADPTDLRVLLNKVRSAEAGGGTDIYEAVGEAVEQIGEYESRLTDFFPAIILMSDGKSKGSLEQLETQFRASSFAYDVPIFSIAFGKADESQLGALADLTSGRSFDGKKDLVKAFRAAKGYN